MTTYRIVVSKAEWPYDDRELLDDAGVVVARARGAAGDLELRDFAQRALGGGRLQVARPQRPRRRSCMAMPGDVTHIFSLVPPPPTPPPGQRPTHCRCGNEGTLRYCRTCQTYRCRACMSALATSCYTCTRKKEDDMGMKARKQITRTGRRAARRFVRPHDTHKLGTGNCGTFGNGGSSVWDHVTCSNCLQNHPDRVEVAACLEEGARLVVHNAIVAAKEKGLRIKRGGCSNCGGGRPNGTVCCVCAPILFREYKVGATEEADEACAKILGVPSKWLYDFVTGFDGDGRAGMYPSAFRLGRSLARRHGAAS